MTFSHEKILSIFGGSQGALAINNFFKHHNKTVYEHDFSIIHITGPKHYHQHCQALDELES